MNRNVSRKMRLRSVLPQQVNSVPDSAVSLVLAVSVKITIRKSCTAYHALLCMVVRGMVHWGG